MPRQDGRAPDELRPVKITRGFTQATPGSVLYESGRTKVLVTASVEDRVPPWMQGRGQGWLTAEYSMLPGSTPDRKARSGSTNRVDGRTHEIQRLVGRSLRSVLDDAGARRADDLDRLRRPRGRRGHAHRLDQRRLHRGRGRAQEAQVPQAADPLAAQGAGRRRLGRHRRRDGRPRPRLLRRPPGRGGHERRDDGVGQVHRGPGHGRGPPLRRRRARGAPLARPAGHRPHPRPREGGRSPRRDRVRRPGSCWPRPTGTRPARSPRSSPPTASRWRSRRASPPSSRTERRSPRTPTRRRSPRRAWRGGRPWPTTRASPCEALGGAPGVHSARYAGPDATDEANTARLLAELAARGLVDPPAAFVCHAVLVRARRARCSPAPRRGWRGSCGDRRAGRTGSATTRSSTTWARPTPRPASASPSSRPPTRTP